MFRKLILRKERKISSSTPEESVEKENGWIKNRTSRSISMKQRFLSYLKWCVILVLFGLFQGNTRLTLSPKEHARRQQQFPSVEDRVKLYMSSWYLPYCKDESRIAGGIRPALEKKYFKGRFENETDYTVLQVQRGSYKLNFSGYAKTFEPLLLEKGLLYHCRMPPDLVEQWKKVGWKPMGKVFHRGNTITYCHDALELYKELNTKNFWKKSEDVPLLSQFGDKLPNTSAQIPMIVKWRPSLTQIQVKNVTSIEARSCWPINEPRSALTTQTTATTTIAKIDTPIIWKLEAARHFQPVYTVAAVDVPWDTKIPKAVWRGSFTGKGNPDSPEGRVGGLEDPLDLCLLNLRCTMVYGHSNSDLIDIGFDATLGFIPKVINGVNMTKPGLSMQQLLQYKMLISLEGNDVASGFKWNLYSNSVILCPTPTKTTYAMEELLQPWVHYVPIHRNGSDLTHQVQWVLRNDDKARQIAERGTQWIHDLLFHPMAKADNAAVRREVLRRYRNLWIDY